MRSMRLPAVIAAICFGLAATAAAHDWIDTSKPEDEGHLTHESPTQEESSAGITGVYRVTVQAGQSIAIQIHDTNGCKADIPVESTTGDAAKIKAQFKAGLVEDQFIKIKGKKPGTSTAIIPVRGEDTVKGTSGSCTEDTRNKLVVTVTASPSQAEHEYGSLWNSHSKAIRTDLKVAYGVARTNIRATLGDLGAGRIDPEPAAMQIYEFMHTGLVAQQNSIGANLNDYKSEGTDILSRDGFPSHCEPSGFGAGSGGPWDQALRDSYLTGFGGLRMFDKEMLRTRKQIDRLTDRGVINAQMTYQPGYFELPAYAPPSQNEDPGTTSVNKLQIQIYGGLSFQEGAGLTGCMWFGGRYDANKGAPTATLVAPDGTTTSFGATQSAPDSWTAQFEDVTPGLTYRFSIGYPDNSATESCALSMPYISYNPALGAFAK